MAGNYLWIVDCGAHYGHQNGKTDKAVFVLKLWFFKHLVEELGYMRRIARLHSPMLKHK